MFKVMHGIRASWWFNYPSPLLYAKLCSTQSDLRFACLCIVLYSKLWTLPGGSVGKALCLDCRVSWVRVPPRAAHFSLKKSVVLGVVELFALHLCCLSPHYVSCMHFFVSVWEFVNLWLAFSASEPDAKKAWATGTARLNTYTKAPFKVCLFQRCLLVSRAYLTSPGTWKTCHIKYVLVNVQAARRYRIYSEAVDYTGRGRSPRRGIVNSRGGYPVRAETPDVN